MYSKVLWFTEKKKRKGCKLLVFVFIQFQMYQCWRSECLVIFVVFFAVMCVQIFKICQGLVMLEVKGVLKSKFLF